MKIAFYAGRCLPVHAKTLDERPLGGTETALIRLAEVLSARGHEVLVFTAYKEPPPSRPLYIYHEEIGRYAPFDLLVCVKDWKAAFYGIPAKRMMFWTGDGADQYVNFGLGDIRVQRAIELFLAVSTWHADTLCESSGFPRNRAVVIGNGVFAPYFSGEELRVRKRLVYTSAPYRGLELLIPIYRRLLELVGGIELHIFSGMNLYDTDRPFQGPHNEHFRKLIPVLQSLPGVVLHNTLLQRQLAREYMKSAVLAYPNTVFETCCITALEAQAAGCPVVASATSALPETVGDGGLVIGGAVGSAEYQEQFVAALQRLLVDDGAWRRLSDNGRQRIQSQFTWERVADRFEALL